jgi:hypothetical protein
MGRKPDGDRPLSGAERQARYRTRRRAPAAVLDPPAVPRVIPRPRRWRAAVAELLVLQAEYAAWLDAMPEPTRDGVTGEALRAIVELDLDEIAAIEPPRGFGRD